MRRLYFCVVILFTALVAVAQEETSRLTTEERLDAIDKVIEKLPKVSGYINSVYSYNGETDDNGLRVKQIWIDMKGDLSKCVDYRILTNLSDGRLSVLDAYARLKFGDGFSVAIGQGKNPILLENIAHPARWGSINCSQIVANYLHEGGRDVGLWVAGKLFLNNGFHRLYYMAGVYNGSGINLVDENRGKDFGARIEYYPMKPLTLALSMYEGNIGDRAAAGKLNRYGASVCYKDSRFFFRCEGMTGIGAYGSALTERTSAGGYAIFGVQATKHIMPVVKYDYFDENINGTGFAKTNYMVGLHCWPTKFLSVEANYTYCTRTSDLLKDYSRVDVAVSVLY